MQVKHRFISNVPDDPAADAAGQVLPSHWNQDHEFLVEPVSLVGNDGGSPAPAKAISVGSGLRLSEGVLFAEPPPPFSGNPNDVDVTFDAPVEAFKVIRFGALGYSYADANQIETQDKVLGVTVEEGLNARVRTLGFITNPTWNFIQGNPIFVGLAGDLSQEHSAFQIVQNIGVAMSANTVFIRPSVGIRRA